jgi:hypothetical protein
MKKYIAGWLLIPASITWIAPIIFGTAVYREFFRMKADWPTALDVLHLLLITYPTVWLLLLFCCSLGIVGLLLRHSPLYPKLSTAFALLVVGGLLVVAFMNAVAFKELLDKEDSLIMLGLAVASFCWWAYMKYSARVRATFLAS